MRKWLACKAMVIATLLMANKTGAQHLRLQQYKAFPAYASSSALAWYRSSLFVVGDDAPTLLVLNKRLREKRQVRMFRNQEQRIPYQQKPDLEAATLFQQGNTALLWVFPSFSTPTRNRAVIYALNKDQARPVVYPLELGKTGLQQVNIEGATMVRGNLLLANRANRSAPVHYLLHYNVKDTGLHNPEKVFTLQLPPTRQVVGISGLHFLEKNDLLLLTVSTESTSSSTADGQIGDSYLALVRGASKQMESGTLLKADTLINLSSHLGTPRPMKIESVTIKKEKRRNMQLYLAADNDDGTSHLFRFSFTPAR